MNRSIISLLIVLSTSRAFALTPAQWQFRQTIEVGAPGLVQVNVLPETFNIARPDLSDLRIVDATEKEIPFLVDQMMPRSESMIPPKDFRAQIASTYTRLSITTGTDLAIAGIALEVPAGANFIKSARVEGSADEKSWQALTSDAPIFSTRSGASRLRVQFPEGKWRFLRLSIDDNRTPPVPWSGAQLIIAGSPAPAEPIPVRIKSRDESPGMTRIGIELPAANLQIASLRITTPESVFTRAVTVATSQLSEERLDEQTLSSAVLYRVNLEGKSESRLDIPLEKQVSGRDLILLINNGDSPPLLISEIRAERRITRLLFFASTAGPHTLLSGNIQCDLPRYDVSQLGEQLRRAEAVKTPMGPPIPNSGYAAASNLPQVFNQGARIELTAWKFRKPIQVASPGVQQLELDPDVLSRTDPDLHDLRIVSEGAQFPYLVERTSIERAVSPAVAKANNRERPKISRWRLTLPEAAIPITRIGCDSSSTLFERSFRIWEELADERGNNYPSELAQTMWRRLPNQAPMPLMTSLQRSPKGNIILIETDDGDNPAIELHNFRAYYSVTRLIFTASLSRPIELYYGNDEVSAPRYDAKLISAQLLRSERKEAALGIRENLKSERITETLTGSSRYIFWGVLGIVVTSLLFVISRILPKTA